MKTKQYSPHILSACALFILGNAVISMPIGTGCFWAVVMWAFLTFVVMLFIKLLIKLSVQSKIILYITATIVGLAAIYGAITTFLDYIKYLKEVQMPQASIALLSAVLLGVVIIFCLSNDTAIYKYSLLVAALAATVILICFLSSIKYFEFSLIKTVFKKPNFAVNNFLRGCTPVAVLPFWLNRQQCSSKPIFFGSALGFVILLLCIAQANLILGNVADETYPYLKAVGVISSGSLFTRLDGFVYYLFFVTSLTKIVICIKTVKKCWTQNK